MERIQKRIEEVKLMDLKIIQNREMIYEDYQNINPQTKHIIDRFGLDDRLFNQDKFIN